MRKRILFILMCVVLGIGLSGCGSSNSKEEAKPSQGYPVKWTVMLDGKEVDQSIPERPKKAVSMSQATTEMMLALNLEDQMAGTAFLEESIYEPLKKSYEKVPVIAEKWPSYETFMAVKPDFVTGWDTSFTKKGIPAEKIQNQKIPIYVPESMQNPNADLNTLFQDMMKLGEIFGKKEQAQRWVDMQKVKLQDVQDKLAKNTTKRVFIFDSDSDEPFTVFNGYTNNILKLIGAENVMSGKVEGKTWGKTNWETVVASDPDYIIVVEYETSARNNDTFESRVEKIKANPQLQNVKAVKENHFIKVKLSEITPGVRTIDALERLSNLIHQS